MEKNNAYLRLVLTKQLAEHGEAAHSHLDELYDAFDERTVATCNALNEAYDVANENIGTLATRVHAIHSRFDELNARLDALAQPKSSTKETSKKESSKPEETSKKEETVRPKETIKPKETAKQQQVQDKNASIKSNPPGRHEGRVDALIKKHNGDLIPVLKHLAYEVDTHHFFHLISFFIHIIGLIWFITYLIIRCIESVL